MSKKGLFEQIADAISRGRWARKDLDNLDNRAFRMQGNSKTWSKNADKMNAQANALQSKAAYNEYLADKLRSDALDRVNEGNKAWNSKLEDFGDKQRMYNAVSEANDLGSGSLYNRNGAFTGTIFSNDPDHARRAARELGYDKSHSMDQLSPSDAKNAFENMASNYYPMDGYEIQKMNISNSNAMDYLDDGYPSESWARRYWEDASNNVNQFVNDNKLGTYHNSYDPNSKWKAMFDLQQVPARYRK